MSFIDEFIHDPLHHNSLTYRSVITNLHQGVSASQIYRSVPNYLQHYIYIIWSPMVFMREWQSKMEWPRNTPPWSVLYTYNQRRHVWAWKRHDAAGELDTADSMSHFGRNCLNGWTMLKYLLPINVNCWACVKWLTRLQRSWRRSIFLEWGITNGNYRCLSDNLESVGKDSLFQ